MGTSSERSASFQCNKILLPYNPHSGLACPGVGVIWTGISVQSHARPKSFRKIFVLEHCFVCIKMFANYFSECHLLMALNE